MSTPRADKIQSILAARKPMAAKANHADEMLNQIEQSLRQFKDFAPGFAEKLDGEPAQNVRNLVPEADVILSILASEKSKLALLSSRFQRPTLNVGVAGRARQGKSTFLQMLTGLTPDEIPSGQQGHCTGAPSVIVHHESDETYAEICFHSANGFLANVIVPFFDRLQLGSPPQTLAQFKEFAIPQAPSVESVDPTTDTEHLNRLRFFQTCLPQFERYLTGQTVRVGRDDIRSHIAQDDLDGKRCDASGNPYSKWVAVKIATVYCRFPHEDLGAIALVDTPGIGDFVSGAEDRLVEMIGRNLDSIFFVRMPEGIGALIKPEDASLHSVVTRAIRDLSIDSWSYFLVNKAQCAEIDNTGQIPRFMQELAASAITTRRTIVVECSNRDDVRDAFASLLDDIAANLASLDTQLFTRHSEGIRQLATSIKEFADKAAVALPNVGKVAPDRALHRELFSDVWINLGTELQALVNSYRAIREEKDQEFLATVAEIFAELEKGPGLPDVATIAHEAAPVGYMQWHANKMHELRVKFSSSFEGLDRCLDTSFDKLREELLNALASPNGGKLGGIADPSTQLIWQKISECWEGHAHEEVMRHAIQLLLDAGLSFRGFIQPRVRQCLDVLDSDSTAASDFAFMPGDDARLVTEKLEMGWENACYKSRTIIEQMSVEPPMARFAAVEDFREAVMHSGGAVEASGNWMEFYYENRSEIWPKSFEKLIAAARLQKEWRERVEGLKGAGTALLSAKE